MKPIVKNIMAVIAGIILGSIVNMGIVSISGQIIPPPEGVDVNDLESLKSSAHLFEAKHFIFPFLAHALGTLVGALFAAKIAASHKMKMAMIIGFFFLLGGITMAFMVPAPSWFIFLDLGLAYIPMARIGGNIGSR
ncbi:MAG: hypothetical protein DWQ44_00550 [Bacteroidetes bacterium]|nr:MAG: hypothetical protein DWQ33_03925 [Bacteroidota bacterium]REK07566.1 MAG: hypothetical protein DWQ39_01345 [Bacteroidota bacterium]REK37001.1 MAG: hypothetical protein DWQ44_00550 [Bacteroidota bacterium]REK47822.1 MAG: hypothetical protein DWQ48_11610 [Bacteroidota bacterium]